MMLTLPPCLNDAHSATPSHWRSLCHPVSMMLTLPPLSMMLTLPPSLNAHLVTNETSVWFGWFYPTDVKDQMVVSEHDDTTDVLRRTRSCTKNELTTITTTWNQYYRALYVL